MQRAFRWMGFFLSFGFYNIYSFGGKNSEKSLNTREGSNAASLHMLKSIFYKILIITDLKITSSK